MHKYVTRQNHMFLHRLGGNSGPATDLDGTEGVGCVKDCGNPRLKRGESRTVRGVTTLVFATVYKKKQESLS